MAGCLPDVVPLSASANTVVNSAEDHDKTPSSTTTRMTLVRPAAAVTDNARVQHCKNYLLPPVTSIYFYRATLYYRRMCDTSVLGVRSFLVRDVIYTSRANATMSVSVCLSVTEVLWRIIANLGFKFRSTFTAHCGRGACREEGRDHLALC